MILARESYLSPKESPEVHYHAAERRLKDGYAVILLRDILSALDALGLRFYVRPEGYDWEALRAERLEWQTMEAPFPSPVLEPPIASLTDEKLLELFGYS